MEATEMVRLALDIEMEVILEYTAERPKTASQISKDLRIPHSACYRKLKMLTEAHLLDEKESGMDLNGAHHPRMYVSNLEKAFVALEHGEMRVFLKLKDQNSSTICRLTP